MASDFFYGGWPPYVPVAERKRQAERAVASLKKKGRICTPVVIEGRTIARTFWGKQWCVHLETYSDYASRLPRGRTYVRNGSVVDLQIENGKITALVAGSDVYQVEIKVHALKDKLWQAILKECAGKVASLVELLQGRLSDAVMEVVTRSDNGLFPASEQISFRCSCPDSAWMCKHVAAVLYGVGARFDHQPELLFLLRQVDPQQLISQAGSLPISETGGHQPLQDTDLSALFGIELGETPVPQAAPAVPKPASPAKSVPAAKAKPTTRRKAAKTLTASDLSARGIPRHMVQSWLASGVLLHSGQRGVYLATKETPKRIDAYLQRRMESDKQKQGKQKQKRA
ncbi:SWIM zinc finger family protein [Noviherbaspirillum saxi]|uniref:SWIM-type domain-containing protein n=1 Tax=Noviherbaspirillum saxi TaxID=2320863 RepID=A0A3A3FT41_9BURK|nr:SWIM zinc finger family protein [Noviherbaspirillum saxi]RJF97648.1 hypothetical protein D3871_03255 [Noviherbaspirillum saxi]